MHPSNDYFTTDRATHHSKRAAVIMLLVGAMTFGSFLWLRMRLVSDMPRQAYADPEAQAPRTSPEQHPQAAPPQHPDDSTKVIDLDDADTKPYTVNDASGGVN